ncbi:MAG: hypothetical protein ACKO45_00585 [Cyanobium sp.]
MQTLLTLPMLPEAELQARTQEIHEHHPDLLSSVLPIPVERFPTLSREDIIVIAGISAQELLHTPAAQQWTKEGRFEGEAQGEAEVTLGQLNCSCAPSQLGSRVVLLAYEGSSNRSCSM